MSNRSNVLIVENELLIVDLLKKAITSLDNGVLYEINASRCCDSTLQIMEDSTAIDLAIININIPPLKNKTSVCVEGIISKLKSKYPEAKTILFSSNTCAIQIHSVLNTINPESLIIKSDIDYTELVNAIKTVLNASPYYSKTVLHYIRNSMANSIKIDHIDKAILHYLSLGKRTKDLPNLVHLSKSAVENRKRKLKDSFGIFKGNDQQLLDRARQKGFV